MNYAVRRGLGLRTPASGKKMEKDCRTANQPARNWERDNDIPTRSRATLPSSSSLAFHLPSPRRLHLCLHLSSLRHYHPPSTFTDAASSTFARYADTSLQPIEIFIPARLPSQFMPRTSEMHCHRRGIEFPPRHSPSPSAIAIYASQNSRETSVSFLFLHPRQKLSSVFSSGKIRKEREARSLTLSDNRRDRANVDILKSTYTFYLHADFTLRCYVCIIHYDTSDTTKIYNCFARHAAINSTFSRYWKKAPLYVCLTRTKRMNNRIVKYFNSPW